MPKTAYRPAFGLLLALVGILTSISCESIQLRLQPTTTPISPAAQVAAAQHDLDTAWALAKLGEAFHPKGDWKVIETQLNSAQAAIDLALVAVDEKPADMVDIINAATKSVTDFKKRAK